LRSSNSTPKSTQFLCSCAICVAADSIAIDHDVSSGQVVSTHIVYPFLPLRRQCMKGRTTIEAVYQEVDGPQRTIVGKITLRQPPGTRGGPHAKPLR